MAMGVVFTKKAMGDAVRKEMEEEEEEEEVGENDIEAAEVGMNEMEDAVDSVSVSSGHHSACSSSGLLSVEEKHDGDDDDDDDNDVKHDNEPDALGEEYHAKCPENNKDYDAWTATSAEEWMDIFTTKREIFL